MAAYFMANLRLGDKDALSSGIGLKCGSVSDRDRTILWLWNSRIQWDDDVYILGNYVSEQMKNDLEKYGMFFRGNKHLVLDEYDYHMLNNINTQKVVRTITPEILLNYGYSNYRLLPGRIEADYFGRRLRDEIYLKSRRPDSYYGETVFLDSESHGFLPLRLGEASRWQGYAPAKRFPDQSILFKTYKREDGGEWREELCRFFLKISELPRHLGIFFFKDKPEDPWDFEGGESGVLVLNSIEPEEIQSFKKFFYLFSVGDLAYLWGAEDDDRLSKWTSRLHGDNFLRDEEADKVYEELVSAAGLTVFKKSPMGQEVWPDETIYVPREPDE